MEEIIAVGDFVTYEVEPGSLLKVVEVIDYSAAVHAICIWPQDTWMPRLGQYPKRRLIPIKALTDEQKLLIAKCLL